MDPWVGKIPWRRRERLTTPVSWPKEVHGLYGRKESDTTERFSLSLHLPASQEIYIQVKKQQLDLDIEQWTSQNLEIILLMTDVIFLGSKIIADGDCSHEIKRCLLLVRKAMTNLDSTLKSRDINLQTKVHIVEAMVFPVVMYRCES